jgi:hypothetical protein
VPELQEKAALGEARRLLSGWLDHPKFRIEPRDVGADIVVEQGQLWLAVELKHNNDAASVGSAIAQVKEYAGRLGKRSVPVVATRFMGDVGKRLCDQAGVSWFDLSGNAHIVAPGLRIIIEGKPNKYVRRGRPSSAFAPKSARIARHLLIEPQRFFRQQELSRETGLDDGYTSRIVRRLDQDGLLEKNKVGAIRVRDPNLMLDAWAETYAFDKHYIVRGHVTARAGDELLSRLAKTLEAGRARYAATGLAAAWLHTEFAGFRLVTFFVERPPSEKALKEMGFREEPKGANVWLVTPDDEGVFDGVVAKGGILCVHPVQAYLDLLAHPERAGEAADALRARLLKWKP